MQTVLLQQLLVLVLAAGKVPLEAVYICIYAQQLENICPEIKLCQTTL